MERGPGAPSGNQNAVKVMAADETIVDNVHDCLEPPTGNSKDAGLRRLRKAAEDTIDQQRIPAAREFPVGRGSAELFTLSTIPNSSEAGPLCSPCSPLFPSVGNRIMCCKINAVPHVPHVPRENNDAGNENHPSGSRFFPPFMAAAIRSAVLFDRAFRGSSRRWA